MSNGPNNSGISGGGGGNTAAVQQQSTPSGITYEEFMQMPEAQRYSTMEKIITDSNINVPGYLDRSATTKVMYALGMNNKPELVSDAQLDAMQGREVFRTVNDAGVISADDIIQQIRQGDYTQLSGKGGSVHGRALYFATDFNESTIYGDGRTARVMRAKIKPNANMISEDRLLSSMKKDAKFGRTRLRHITYDNEALYAIAHGYDGWFSSRIGYEMIINRGALVASSRTKREYQRDGSIATGWNNAVNG